MTDLHVPVLVVGGGGCGLSSSILLSNLGVDHLLVERTRHVEVTAAAPPQGGTSWALS